MKNEILHIRLEANMQKSLTNIKTWLVLSVFVLLGAIVPQEAKANYDSRGLWYFDNTNTNWTNVYLIVGRGDWTQAVKMVLQYDNIYKAESTWDNTYAFFFADSACGYSTGSGSAKDIVGSRTGNYTGNFTSKPSNNIFSPSGNGTNITGTWSTAYHLKHPWGTGNDNDWSWKVLKYNNGVYTLNALYASGKGCNYSKPNSTDEAGYVSNPTLVGSPTTGDECIFTFNPSNNTITITKEVTCNDNPDFSVSLSESEVAVGCTEVTASIEIEGNDSPTVTWSSSNPSVATINSSGVITINGAGETTITATTIEAGGFCGGVEKPATLTVKSPSVKVTANDNSLCEGETLTLTATLTNCGADNSIQWYKGDEPIEDETSATLTLSSVTTDNSGDYKAVVSGGILCSAIESSINISVNTLPGAPTNLGSATICNGDKTTLPEVTGSWYEGANTITPLTSREVQPTETTSYFATSKSNNCESSLRTEYVVTVKSLADANNYELTKTSEDYTGTTITLQTSDVNVNNNAGAVESIYFKQNGSNVTPINVGDYEVYVTTAATNDICAGNIKIGTFEITCPTIAAPDITTSATVCAGTPVTLSNYNGVNTNTVKWYSNSACTSEVTQQVIPTNNNKVYYAKAYHEASGCYSSEYSTLTFTINPKPTITITGNNSAVLYEDVTLTATGENIANVVWTADKGTITKDATDPKEAILTYDQTGTVTVTATATSAAGCTSAATKTVTFSAEDCNSTTRNDLIITCNPNGYYGDVYLHIWPNGEGSLTEWPGYKGEWKDNVWRWEISASLLSTSKQYDIIFNNNAGAQTQNLDHNLIPGNQYNYTLNHTNWGDGNNRPTMGTVDPIPLSQPATISTPAVKTVSATSEEGSGVVNFTGKIIKTGCAATSSIYYGYQFKKADEAWPTTGVEASNIPVKGKLIPLTNASETALYYQFSADVENLGDGDYHFRAYVINGYGRSADPNNYDQGVYYGLDKLVTVSTVQVPVKTASIELTTADGIPVANDKKYCVGETGYIKVTSDVKYTTIQWKTDKGTEIDVNGNNGIYSFVAKGDDNIWVMLSNKYNNPESPAINQNPLVISTFADPILPRVSLNKVSICSNDAVGATVKLTNVVKGQTYQLYQQIDNGDGTFTEQAISSAKTQTEEVTDNTELVLHTLTNTAATGKYFVKTYTTVCEENIVATQPFTFTVVDATEVFISLEPISAQTTPWMPAKFTVNASDAYTLNVTKGNPSEPATEVEVNQNGNKVSVKIPLPEDATGGEGQYENVVFPGGATTQYTITATLSATGGDDNPCATPTSATINLIPYVEECTEGH